MLSIFRITESQFAVQLYGDIAAQGASKEIGRATTSANVIDFATARRRRTDGPEPGPLRPRPAA